MIELIIVIVTLLVFLVTTLPITHISHWLIRGLDFPRLHFLITGLILTVLSGLLLDFSQIWSWIILGINLTCTVYQFTWIFPYTILHSKESNACTSVDPNNVISVLNSNVLQTNKNSQSLIDIVKEYKPNILITLETNAWWESQLDVIRDTFPYIVACPQENLYGMHLYSSFPLENTTIKYLVEEDVPSIHTRIVLPSGKKIRLHILHPAPPSPTENETSAERDIELIMVAKSLEKNKQPAIVTGDLNDVAWSATTRLFRNLSQMLDPRIGRGMINTFHAGFMFLRWPLDHLFHSEHFSFVSLERVHLKGSDHFSLYSKLVLDREVKDDDTSDKKISEEDEELIANREEETDTNERVPRPLKSNHK